MTTINIFISGDLEKEKIDLKDILQNSRKIFRFFLKSPLVYDNSCLFSQIYSKISFDLVFCSEEKIKEINNDYRGKNAVTDVITFAIFADSDDKFILDKEIYLGEVLLSEDKIITQAKEFNHSFEKELYYLISHGILHLLGFDHQTSEEYDFMVKFQNDALKKIKI